MLLYKKMLHRVNFEDVSIETKLEKSYYGLGDQVKGEVEVKAGNRDSNLGYLYLYLKSEYVKDPNQPLARTEVKLDKFIIGHPFHIQAGQTVQIPFSFTLPFHTPITYRSVKVFTHTGLDIHAGDDPEDIDYLEVGPSILQGRVFQACKHLDYEMGRTVYKPTERPGEFLQTFSFKKEKNTIDLSFISLNDDGMVLYLKMGLTEQILHVHKHDSDIVIQDKLNKLSTNTVEQEGETI